MSQQSRNTRQLPASITESLPFALAKDTERVVPFVWTASFSMKRDQKDKLEEIRLVFHDQNQALNSGLLMDKYLPRIDVLDTLKGKGHLALGLAQSISGRLDHYQSILDALHSRQECCVTSLKGKDPGLATAYIPATVVWRLVVGMGRTHVWENALALHGLYGFPYIPSSSVKGLVRMAAFWELAEALGLATGQNKTEQETVLQCLARLLTTSTSQQAWRAEFPACTETTFEMIRKAQALFGTMERAGRGLFFDGLPESFPNIEVDIMNPHFQAYYQGSSPPSDDLTPNPIFFLTVGQGGVFIFRFAILPGRADEPAAQDLLDVARNWLKVAITEYGTGAKTRAGYGELQINNSSFECEIQRPEKNQ